MSLEEILKAEPFGLAHKEKERLLLGELCSLTEFHREKSSAYDNILKAYGYLQAGSMEEIPFLPVRAFKELELKSSSEIFKTLTSSGTSGQRPSKIFLDRQTASNQQKALARIVGSFTGKARLPMIIIDSPAALKNRAMFSARGAGILGFSIFAKKKIFALDEDMNLDLPTLKEFLSEHENERILLFGFTFMIWKYFYKPLKAADEKLSIKDGVLLHGGGWKRLEGEKVSGVEFKRALREVCPNTSAFDYYGMAEQTGSISMECEAGNLHVSSYSDVIMRRPKDFSPCDFGERGIIQVLSPIPVSYPGHSILTEDEGVILGEDDCPCKRLGKYFKVLGRIKQAEIRGCSDTFGG